MSRFAVWTSALLIIVAAGCNSSDDKKPFPTSAQSPAIDMPPGIKLPDSDKPDDKRPTENARVNLKIAPGAEIEAAIKANAGKIVVVDIWATWCVPCKKEFPHLVELHDKHAKNGVVCMSVAWDTADDRGNALGFLTQQKAVFTNFLLDRDEDDTKKWLDKYEVGAIPVVLVFGRDGKLAKKFYGDSQTTFSYADVNKLVDELLKK